MADTLLVIIEILKVIALMALFPAQIAWSLISTGKGFHIFLGVSMIVVVYGGLFTAIWRGAHRLIFGPPRRPRRRGSRRR